MKITLKLFSYLILACIIFVSCKSNTSSSGRGRGLTDDKTGIPFNNPDFGDFNREQFKKANVPPGMVYIEGGTYTMGLVQDDVMFDWNTTPKQMHVRSFYMDEAEVTNANYSIFLQYMKQVFPPDNPRFKNIHSSVLPDTLVWRKSLGNTNLLSESYLRHPAYSDYPVVGVSWDQANTYCKCRTNVVAYKKMVDK